MGRSVRTAQNPKNSGETENQLCIRDLEQADDEKHSLFEPGGLHQHLFGGCLREHGRIPRRKDCVAHRLQQAEQRQRAVTVPAEGLLRG